MLVSTFCCFYAVQWVILLITMPGNIIWDISPEAETIKNVHAGHVTVFALISYFIYKLRGKKKEGQTSDDNAQTRLSNISYLDSKQETATIVDDVEINVIE